MSPDRDPPDPTPPGSALRAPQDLPTALERIRRLEAEADRLRQQIEERDRHTEHFLATLAHELRNPLSAVASALEAKEVLDPASDEAVRLRGVTRRQISHLSRLVDDLLDVSRITSDKIELRRQRTDLRRSIRAAVETLQPLIDRSGQRLELALPEEPLTVMADPDRLEQVVGNLLANAVKYTPSGGLIAVMACRQGGGNGGGEALVEVADTGVGIRPELLERIFDLFAQAEVSLDRRGGGMGLGLTLVRRLVELHGGSVTAESKGEGRGSRFRVRLPLAEIDPAESGQAEGGRAAGPEMEEGRDEAAAGPGRASVLVVEDHEDARLALKLLLDHRGHRVGVAEDGLEGVEMAGGGAWDAAVVDLGLPGIDGFEVARRLRRNPRTREMLLCALSGYGQEGDRRRSTEAGFDHHLIKPLQPAELFPLLEEAGKGRGEDRRGSGPGDS